MFELMPKSEVSDWMPQGSRYDDQRAILGGSLQEKLKKMKLFLVAWMDLFKLARCGVDRVLALWKDLLFYGILSEYLQRIHPIEATSSTETDA